MNRKTAVVRGLLLLFAALALVSLLLFCAQADPMPIDAPVNPACQDYIQRGDVVTHSVATGEYVGGLIPEPFLLPTSGAMKSMDALVSLPLSYDLRPLNKLTAIRNQGSCGSCWDFATMGSLESSMMPGAAWDVSENNLKNLAGFDIGCCSGGNRAMSTAYLARWGGAIRESDDPYNTGSCSSPTGLSPCLHVQEIIFLPNRTGSLDNDAIKQAVMDYGAVYTTYYHSDSYYNSTSGGYYFNGSTQSNHAVCIVGWDDNFSAANFRTIAPGNGAFLIRNSWGSYWGKSGYFWMSYYDAKVARTENAVFRAEPVAGLSKIYQYDTLGWTSNTGYGGNTGWFANVFTATSSDSIAAASWYAPVANSSYTLYVYTDPTSGPTSSGGPAMVTSGTIATAGYHTVKLPTTVPVAAGQKFSVVVKSTTPGYNYPICLERPYSGYASSPTASTGQSYMSSTGTNWTDVAGYYANTNVCLKAFTGSGGITPTPGALSVTPSTGFSASGVAGGPFSPGSQIYTLMNTGQSSIDYTANATQPWLGLSTNGGTLAPGATVGVTVSIGVSANSLVAGTYSGAVAFTNTTNDTGSAARTATLTVNTPPPPQAGALSVSPTTALNATGKVGGPFSPSSQSYTLTNTGGTSISWTAGAAQTWVGLSANAGVLVAGASTTVIASINSSANMLAVGSYTNAISFTNTTNGAGNASRAVNLSVTTVAPPPPSGVYQVVPATYSWIDPSAHKAITLGNDSVSMAQYLPFVFTYYSKPYSKVYVGSNGLLGFTPSGMYLYSNNGIPTPTWPNLGIYPYWDNLNTALGGSVRVGTIGSTPNRRMVISWVDVPSAYATSARFTFQAILCEGTNDIIFQYQNVTPTNALYGAGGSATVGIENETGSLGCRFSFNTRSLSNNMAIRFTTLPASVRR